MLSITSLVSRLEADFPNFGFEPSDQFRWSPVYQTVYFDPRSHHLASLLHELSHAMLGHTEYSRDIQLIEMEREAWQTARQTLGPRYDVEVAEDFAEDALDTYRNWLHARSTCPGCSATGVQTKKYLYKCLACSNQWKVNEAKLCALRRHILIT